MGLPDRLGEIRSSHIVELIGELESETLEFKSQLPPAGAIADESKRELCRDFTSLANSGGGHIAYGIKEEARKLPRFSQ